MVVKTFRGLLADGGQERIRLSTMKGKVGYKIIKFQVMPNDPGGAGFENAVQIWKSFQDTISDVIDFSDTKLLAAAYLEGDGSRSNPSTEWIAFFDQEIFNQDIFVTHKDDDQDSLVNYYIELEAVSLSEQGAEYTTIKDIRTQTQ